MSPELARELQEIGVVLEYKHKLPPMTQLEWQDYCNKKYGYDKIPPVTRNDNGTYNYPF